MNRLSYFLFSLFCVIFFMACSPKKKSQARHEKLVDIATRNRLVGFSYLVLDNATIKDEFHYGYSNIDQNRKVDEYTQYRVASISKTVCALTILKLCQEKRLSLDDDISQYLGFSIAPPAHPSWKITPRKLLSHTSSLRDGETYNDFLQRSFQEQPQPSLKKLFDSQQTDSSNLWASSDLSEHYFSYCNLGYVILGTLVESITHQAYYQYVKDSILVPAGIEGAYRVSQLKNTNHLSALYRDGKATNDDYKHPVQADTTRYNVGINAAISSPQGGLRISARELAKVMQLLMNEKEMRQVQWVFDGKNGDDYNGLFQSWCLGLQQVNDFPSKKGIAHSQTMYGHIGDAYGLNAGMFFNPDTKKGIIYIFNGYYGTEGYLPGEYSAFHKVEEELFNYANDYLK